MKYMTTNPSSMQPCSLRDNQIIFHMTRQKHTIKIKSIGHPLINVNKKVDFKSLNFNNHHAI